MPIPDDERLHRYFDGELSPEDATAFESAMTDDDRLKLAALAEVRGLTAAALDAEAANIDLWPLLERKLTIAAHPRWQRVARRLSVAGVGLAAAAALLLILRPGPHVANNDCDVELLETDGAFATVLKMPDSAHPQSPTTTLIWTEED